MNEQQANELFEQLRSGAQQKVVVSKENFMVFRAQWVQQSDREAFIGSADKGGNVSYEYVAQQEGQS
ncbi:hypothetical protein BTR23_19565 [Alkalihalophilus pseudofirmus]|uniref:hypothetical protein n=1 Tax=Alkalihalobacterium alkalinitrilicum TaxID=427920 RepID=UPI00094D6461|nr:hypothetical protein [Alkalihalobacterium alkalinitrilicum]OLO27624.1 hypothetical protein BTR23_19565 [Alkalihalophilus pseudofirmus]